MRIGKSLGVQAWPAGFVMRTYTCKLKPARQVTRRCAFQDFQKLRQPVRMRGPRGSADKIPIDERFVDRDFLKLSNRNW